MKTSSHVLSDQEHATVLAALRYYQLNGLADYPALRPDAIHDIATGGDDAGFVASLNGAGIDVLCERLNFSSAQRETPGNTCLIAIPRHLLGLLTEISRSCKMPAPCGIGSYAIGEKRMRRLRQLVRRLSRGESTGSPDTFPLLTAAKALLVNADDRGDTCDRDNGEEYADWTALRNAVAGEEGLVS